MIDELMKLKDPETGEPVVEGVYRRRRLSWRMHGFCSRLAELPGRDTAIHPGKVMMTATKISLSQA